MKSLSERLDQKILSDRADRLQEKIWKYDDRYEKKPMDDITKEEYRTIYKELKDINKKIKKGE